MLNTHPDAGTTAATTARRSCRLLAFFACFAATGCNQVPPPDPTAEAPPDTTPREHPCGDAIEPPQGLPPRVTYVAMPRESWCGDAEARLGRRVCVHEVPDVETWSEIGLEAAAVDQERTTTYLVPARQDARVPTVFVDANAFEAPEQSLHFKFLTGSAIGLELLDYTEYLDLVLDPGQREWFSGSVTEFIVPGGDNVFGLTVSDGGIDPAATITCEQFRQVYDIVGQRIAIGPVAVVPAHDVQRATLASCDVPVHDPATALVYETYTQGKRCGRLRRYTPEELVTAEQQFEFGWQDILVTCGAPFDIQTVIAGIVTGTRQGQLSHLNVRSANRGTPNCYYQGAYDLFEKWDDQLVELECGPAGATVVPVTQDGSGNWFYENGQPTVCNEGFKPEPVQIVPADPTWTDLVPLLAVPTSTIDERRTALGRFGSKGANLATLYQRIDPSIQHKGFLIPVHYYDAFVHNNSGQFDLGSGPEVLSFAEVINRLLDDPAFVSDGVVRRQRLLALQRAMTAASVPCDPALLEAIRAQILAIWGRDDVMLRFRSSGNAEDEFRFTAAGLYDSNSVCLADQADGDTVGPSRCDPDKRNEEDICHGLKLVWSQLWNMRAFEERSWYSIDHRQVVMGILVNTRTKGELANIIAFSGNPSLRGDRRYLINAQLGELEVAHADPGVYPETSLLTVENGLVVNIERDRRSSELPNPDDPWVLDDARLQELGNHLATIVNVYPIDANLPVFARVYLDTEWKVRPDGTLVVKQVRPYVE